jgi:hypothetical protein
MKVRAPKTGRYAAPDVWQPSLLAGLLGVVGFLRAPRRAWAVECRQWNQYRAYRALLRLGIAQYFDDYARDAIPPQYDDLLGLYRAVMQQQPAVVLELGGGCSTFVLAHALKALCDGDGRDRVLYSVDESDYWQAVVRDRLPEDLRRFVRFYCAQPRLAEVEGHLVSEFDHLPVQCANFVYVDGGLVPGNDIGADVLKFETCAPQDFTILIDGREKTVAFLASALKRSYDLIAGYADRQTIFRLRS